MRIPKVGEKWKRWDGKANGVTVTQVVPPGTSAPSTQAANTHIHYRYDDGVVSDKPLPEFRQKFKDPVEHEGQCEQIHPPTGVRCVGMKNHAGFHINGHHEWTVPPKGATVAVTPEVKAVVKEKMESFVAHVGAAKRAHVMAYYGYDPIDSNPTHPKQGNWDDPDYRRKYNGFK